ncbi:MAG: hypothetical protein UY21_C0001G0032 [Microgenomates group bacterium GW2011_GWA1_48_10]|nr:MAG: hypothetical protein UY21_C0001G0032 [Microgenomates group bacterium GW2011_GWA1_48_10]
MTVTKLSIVLLKKLRQATPLAAKLVFLTGKSTQALHPKHLVEIEKPWYLDYLSKNDIVLDLGCGNGQNSLKAAKKAKHVYGLDTNQASLNQGRSFASRHKITNITFSFHDLNNKLLYPDQRFDRVLFLDVLEHLGTASRQQIMGEIHRILRTDGLLLLAVPNSQTSWKKTQRSVSVDSFTDPDHKIEYSLDGIKKFCSKCKFKQLNISGITYDSPYAPLIDIAGGFSLQLYKKLSLWKKNKMKGGLTESIGFRLVCQKM